MKKTIIYYGNFTLPDCNAAAHRVTSVGKIFRELGYNVIFLGANRDNCAFSGIRPVANSAGFEMYEEAYPSTTVQWFKWLHDISNLEALIKKHPETVAIVLYNSPYTIITRAAKLTKSLGIKLVYDYPEWCDVTQGSLPKLIIKRLDTQLIRKLMPKKVDGLIVISSFMQNHYKDFAKPIVKLTPMVDVKDPIWHAEPYKSSHPISFCFAGTIDAEKDYLHMIVKAFLGVTNSSVGLDIIGVAQEDFRAMYPEILPEKAPENITFFGRLSHTETISHVLGTDYYIFVRPKDLRNTAGFPTKFTEAATVGAPIITTDVSDVKEFIGKSVKGYIIPELSVEAVRSTIEYAVAQNKQEKKENRKICDVFDYRGHTQKVSAWLGELLN